MMLNDIEAHDRVSAVCQGFIGGGVSGEALCMLSDSSFGDVAKILNITADVDDQLQLEVLMASILIGTCLTGIGKQLDLSLRQGQPVVLGQHRNVSDLILLFTEDSMATMNKKLAHLLEEEA